MKRKITFFLLGAISYIVVDIALNGITTMTQVTDGKVPEFTNNEYVSTALTGLSLVVLVTAMLIYVLGLIGPIEERELDDGETKTDD